MVSFVTAATKLLTRDLVDILAADMLHGSVTLAVMDLADYMRKHFVDNGWAVAMHGAAPLGHTEFYPRITRLEGAIVTRDSERTILSLAGVSVRFGGLTAIDNVDLEVPQGEIFALLGPNGAGKTTLFNVIGGILAPSEGRVRFEGRDIGALPPHARCQLGIARTFQITQPFPELTVEENVMAGAITHHRRIADMRADARKYIEFVGLAAKRHDFAKHLSTGQRKRLEVARVLATRPRLLLLDEITGGVDHASIPGLVELVKRLRREGVTVVIVEHNMRVLTELADRALFLDRGVVLARGTPQELAEHPDVVALYLESEHA